MHTYKCTYIQTDNDGRAIEQGASEGAMDVTDDSSLIPRLHFPSLLGLFTDPSLLPATVHKT